jgi:hypothetical protein
LAIFDFSPGKTRLLSFKSQKSLPSSAITRDLPFGLLLAQKNIKAILAPPRDRRFSSTGVGKLPVPAPTW